MSPLMTLINWGKLVDARQAQEAADGRHTGIEREFLLFRPLHLGVGMRREILIEAFFRTDDHGAEFEAPEGLAIPADAPMAKENRAAIDRHQGRDRDEERDALRRRSATPLQDRKRVWRPGPLARGSAEEKPSKPVARGIAASSIPDSGASGNNGSLITNSGTSLARPSSDTTSEKRR